MMHDMLQNQLVSHTQQNSLRLSIPLLIPSSDKLCLSLCCVSPTVPGAGNPSVNHTQEHGF